MRYSDYLQMDDSSLLAIIKSESPDSDTALDILIKRHKKLVLNQAHSMYLIGADKEDLIQEGMIGLYKAIREYDNTRSESFTAFAISIIQNQLINTITAYNRKKYKPLNDSISLDAPLVSTNANEDIPALINIMEASNPSSNPEDFVIDKEKVSMIEYELGKLLSSFEKSVYNLYLTGMDYKQIANKLGKTPKAVDNARCRIKSKLSKLLETKN